MCQYIYAVRNLKGRVLQVNALLKAGGSEVLGILVLDISVENLIAIWNAQPPLGDGDFDKDAPNNQGSSGPDVLSLSEGILGHRCDGEVELGEAWGGGSGDRRLVAGRGKGGRKRGYVSASV